MRLHFEVGLPITLERALSRLLKPLLEAIHTEAVFTGIALQWVNEDAMAYPAFKLLREHVLVDHPVSINDVYFHDFLGRISILAALVLRD
jgi:hypothetical protein